MAQSIILMGTTWFMVHMEETGGRTSPEVGQDRMTIITCGFDASTALYAVSVLIQ